MTTAQSHSGNGRLPMALARNPITWLVMVLVLCVIYLGVVSYGSANAKPFLEDGGPSGGLAFKRFAERFNIEVEPTADPQPGTTLFVVGYSLGSYELLDEFVQGGGTMVTSYRSSLGIASSDVVTDGRFRLGLEPSCDAPWTQGVNTARVSEKRNYPVIKAGPGDVGCFPAGRDTYFAVEKQVGFGRTISFGSDALFHNGLIGEADNAVLVANLLGAQSSDQSAGMTTKVQLFDPSLALEAFEPSYQKDPLDYVPSAVWISLIQIAVIVVVLAFYRGRRLGRLVSEDPLVALPASSIVVAKGELLDTANQTNAAARTLRADVRRRIALLIGVDPSVDVDVLIATASSRTGIDSAAMRRLLIDAPVSDNAKLLELSQAIEKLHQEVIRVR